MCINGVDEYSHDCVDILDGSAHTHVHVDVSDGRAHDSNGRARTHVHMDVSDGRTHSSDGHSRARFVMHGSAVRGVQLGSRCFAQVGWDTSTNYA